MKRIVTFILSAALLGSLCAPASAEYTAAGYREMFDSYAAYYRNTYVPCYQSYNQSLDFLKYRIEHTAITTQEQADLIFAFLQQLKSDKADFFGTRETLHKSRQVVPALRSAIHEAAVNHDYDAAVSLAMQLEDEIMFRVDFLDQRKDEINFFDPSPPQDPLVTEKFDIYILPRTPYMTIISNHLYYNYTVFTGSNTLVLACAIPSFSTPPLASGLYQDVPVRNGYADQEDFGAPQPVVTAISCGGGILSTTGGTYTYNGETAFYAIDGKNAVIGCSDADVVSVSSGSPYSGNSSIVVAADGSAAEAVYIVL